MVFGIMFSPANLGLMSLVFMLGGVQVAVEETLEDSFCAELVEPAKHGMAFFVLATVNGVGDFLSSAIVGLLWSTLGTTVAFGYDKQSPLRPKLLSDGPSTKAFNTTAVRLGDRCPMRTG